MMQMDTFKKTMELNISFFLLQVKNKKALKNYKRLPKETKNQIEAINDGDDDEIIRYRKVRLKIRFERHDNLPFGKTFLR